MDQIDGPKCSTPVGFAPIPEAMFRSRDLVLADVGAELRRLGTDHVAFQLERGWFVFGPNGLFVVAVEDGDVVEAGRWASARACLMRSELEHSLGWVPFIDALVVTADELANPATPCVTVPMRLLLFTVSDGPRTVDNGILARLGRLTLRPGP